MLIIENIRSTFVEDRWLYENEIYLEALAKFLEPIIYNNMVCLSIFRGGVVTYVCMVCLSICLTSCSFYILFIFKLVKSCFFKMQGNKCKFLEIIPYDLDGNCYEIIVSMCHEMFFGVPMRNVTTSGAKKVRRIT